MERSDYYYAGDTVIHYIITDGEVSVENGEISIGTHTRLIQNEDLMGTFKFKDMISDSDDLIWGSVFPRSVSFSVSTELETLKGIKLNIYDYFNDEPSTLKKRGSFIVTSDKRSDGRNYRDVEGYDELILLQNAEMMDWYNALLPTASSTTTLAQFRESFASHFGLTQASETLANDNMPVAKTVEGSSGLSGGYVAKCIGEITGTFPRIGKEDGKLHWKELEDNSREGTLPADDLYPSDTLYPDDPSGTEMQSKVYLSCYHEDFTSTQITRLQIRTNEEDIGITYGTEGNDYIIQSNFLLYGKTAAELRTVASNLLPKLTNRAYVPFTMLAKGNPELEAGDHIYFIVNNSYCRSYILSRELQGVAVLRDNYEARGLETREPVSNDVNEELVITKARYMYLRKDLDGLELVVGDSESGLVHTVAVLDGKIDLRVAKTEIVGDLNAAMSSGITITPDNINISSDGSLTISTSHFKLDENGNVELSGTLTAGTSIYGASVHGGFIDGSVIYSYGNDSTLIIQGANLSFSHDVLPETNKIDNYGMDITANDGGHTSVLSTYIEVRYTDPDQVMRFCRLSCDDIFVSESSPTPQDQGHYSYLRPREGKINGSPILTQSNWAQYVTDGEAVSF